MSWFGVAPPRGERGLKLKKAGGTLSFNVAPPRGERGLKYLLLLKK